MIRQTAVKNLSVLIIISVLGLGLALALPWIASAQIYPAQKEAAPEAMRFYVSKSGNSTNGRTWNKAFTRVQDALGVADSGDEIWVAAGVYTPGVNSDNSFNLVSGVEMYGGFRGHETQRTQRDWEANLTILSGDIHGDDTSTDGVVLTTTHIDGLNSYNVVFADGATGAPITETTVLDGFTITAGDARLDSFPEGSGGGFFCDGSGVGSECSPSLYHIVFSGNKAFNKGGGMVNYVNFKGVSSPNLTEVIFSGNSSSGYGGALSNIALTGSSSPILTGVQFSGNSAAEGGAMFNVGFEGGDSSPKLVGVTFAGNNAGEIGGAMYNDAAFGSTSSPSLSYVTFSDNTADQGGAIYNRAGFDVSFSDPSLNNVTFSGNSAVSFGGAMYNNAVTKNSTSSPNLNQVTFSGNSADFGGAMYNNGDPGISSPKMTNVLFSGNSADSIGGAVYNDGFNGDSSPTLVNVTISGNSAGLWGGGMFNSGASGGKSKPKVRNSIVWNNKDGTGSGNISANIFNNASTTSFYHSLLQGAGGSGSSWTSDTSYSDGGGNIDKDPLFLIPVDPLTAPTTAGNLRLMLRSPAVDSGKNSYSAGVLIDLDGEARVADGDLDGKLIVDMGAFERQNYVYLPGVVTRH